MRRTVWVWIVVAFVVGLLPGVAAAWWLRTDALSARQQLVARNSELHAENQLLLTRLNAAEATVSALTARLAQAAPAPASSAPSTSAVTSDASGGTPSGPPNITERAASPQQVKAGGKLTLTVKLTGHATKVNMRIAGPGGFDKTYFLGRESFNGTGEVWGKVIDAPSAAGTYNYYSIAYDEAGKKYPMPGVSEWTFQVQ